jgi:dephospho-CoA kinase
MATTNLIGISGTNGAGKDLLGQILQDYFNFVFISMTDVLREDLVSRNLPPDREHSRQLSAQWRRESGLGVLIDKAMERYHEPNQESGSGLAVSSIRNPGEADRVHELGGIMIWLDADPQIRYKRLQANLGRRGAHRNVDDQKTFEEFMADERAEMYPESDDPAVLSMIDVKKKADFFIINDSNDPGKLLEEIRRILQQA